MNINSDNRALVSGSFKNVQDIVSRTCVRDRVSGGKQQHHAEVHAATETPILRILGVDGGDDVGSPQTRVRGDEAALRNEDGQLVVGDDGGGHHVLQHRSNIHFEFLDVVRDGDKYMRHGRTERQGRAEAKSARENGGAEAQSAHELTIQQLRRVHPAGFQDEALERQRRQEQRRRFARNAEHLVR